MIDPAFSLAPRLSMLYHSIAFPFCNDDDGKDAEKEAAHPAHKRRSAWSAGGRGDQPLACARKVWPIASSQRQVKKVQHQSQSSR